MSVSLATRQAYSEIDEFLSMLDDGTRNEVPKKLQKLFKEEKDKEYYKKIDPVIPIKEQDLKRETLAIIALLNLQYWCKDEQEKERLKKIYFQNEKEYQEMLRDKFNPDDIFKKRTFNIEQEQENSQVENTQMIEYKEPLIKRIINKILSFFGRN